LCNYYQLYDLLNIAPDYFKILKTTDINSHKDHNAACF